MIREILMHMADGATLTEDEAASAMRCMMTGEASPEQIAAFLTALKVRGETIDEIAGLAREMRSHAIGVDPSRMPVVDTCGTGGGRTPTFNISTAAALVAAGAGAAIAKHGNRAVTSRAGSADLLEALGVCIELDAEQVSRCIDEAGIGFLFAPIYHPAMKYVGPVRRQLPFRTVFNCLGPLTNPAGVERQVIGVYEPRLVELVAGALARLGCRHGLVVHGLDGLDELSTLGPTLVAEVRDDVVTTRRISPEELGIRRAAAADLAPGTNAAGNAAIVRSLLEGEQGARRDIVLLNAAAALYVAGVAEDLAEGLQLAGQSLASGSALEALETLRRLAPAA